MTLVTISQELKETGFSIRTVKAVLKKSGGVLPGNTSEYFVILRASRDFQMFVNSKFYQIQKDYLVYIPPGQSLRFVEPHKQDIYAITFTSAFYERSAIDIYILHSDLFFSETLHIVPSFSSESDFKKLFVNRLAIYESKNKDFYTTVGHNCIEALLLDGLLNMDISGDKKKNLSELNIINNFKVLLERHYKKDRRVEFYSGLLETYPRKLTEICEHVLGKNAKKIITEKVVKEAINLLENSEMNISEITYELGFNDEGYFSNFIKKHTGKTPKKIRRKAEDRSKTLKI